ncbi:oxidoreductase [Penicillium atrosanguineum]|uniref:Transcription factor IIIC zinc-finger n=1 Tax=Penicillium atrosanguineum TaxID=1132637 RepID=UPI0023847075|nr:Transcription factor IIIC zinc-finger [Penicillium atrosanguineum]KAJ5135950.1 oxidoreductase [Penicillium atrosanguineum]KAJ5292304.1 Transcription factor IIIC zinc-finger [Penicillium atrosanguineum]
MVLAQPQNQHVKGLFDLTGKVAVVTGGARGIGLEVSRGLAEAGANVALIYNSSKTAEAIAAEIASANNVRAVAYQANVTDQSQIELVIQQVAQDFGKLDILVANSGIVSSVAAEDYTPSQWSEIIKVNLDGAFYSAQAAARIFKQQGYGNVIFTASVSATLVNVPQKQAAYNASKAGVVQLAKCLSVEWVDFCRVNCVSPGFIATEILDIHPEEWRAKWYDMIPAKRMAQAYELKGAYVFCASDASSYMTGADIIIDGGYTLP